MDIAIQADQVADMDFLFGSGQVVVVTGYTNFALEQLKNKLRILNISKAWQ